MNRHLYNFLLFLILSMTVPALSFAQDITVTGQVKAADDGLTLVGVSVSATKTSQTTVTDAGGNFKISVPASTQLNFSYIGYLSQKVNITGSRPITIILQKDINALNEVVVSGLASGIKRSNLANAVTSISSNELTGTAPPQTVTSALYGKFPELISG